MMLQPTAVAPIRWLTRPIAVGVSLYLLAACASTTGHVSRSPETPSSSAATHAVVPASPRGPTAAMAEITVVAPQEGWQLGRISWIAADRDGLIYLLQRGTNADPVVVLDGQGRVVRSWGSGLYATPHSVRIDPEGNIWTVDAAASRVIKFSPQGVRLLQIEVGGQPADCVQNPARRGFCGATDVAWAPNGHVFVADGYANARIVEYTPDGEKVREWGKHGSGPGEFNLPHSIAVDRQGAVYVADRENGRVQRFDVSGRGLGEWLTDGNPYTLAIHSDAIWVDVLQPLEPDAPRRRGRLVKVERASGRVLARVDPPGGHGTAITADGGELLVPAGNKLYRINVDRKLAP